MMGILGYFLSGMIALHAVLGCCLHHAHVAHRTPCCLNRSVRADACSCEGPSTDGAFLVGATCCDDTVTGRGHRTDCRGRHCEWGVQRSGVIMPEMASAAMATTTGSAPPRLLPRSYRLLERAQFCGEHSRTRLHAVLAVFLI